MADNQGDFISKFVPKSHFFTDSSTISQTAEQAFGPASTSEFRITSSFNISAGDNKVYAICRGVVLIQPQAGSTNKVNVIIRPYTQPILGFNFKYFIYRGLSLADFFTGNLVRAADATTSDFINNINASFLAFHSSTDPKGAVHDFLAIYKGDSMSVLGTNIVNIGVSHVSSDTKDLNKMIHNQNAQPSTSFKLGVLKYNKNLQTATIQFL